MPNGYQGGYDPQFDPNYDPYTDPQMTDPNMSGGDPYADPQGGGYADPTQPPAVDHNATILEMQQQMALLQAQLAQKDQQAQQQAQQQAMTDQERQLEEAKKMLGVDQLLKQQEMVLIQLEESKRAVEMRAVKDRNPDFDEKLVLKEIEKIRETNPELAESMSKNPAGLELVFKSIKANAMAQNAPDKMTGNRYGGGQTNQTTRKVAEGNASEMELGSYLLGLK